MHVAEFINIVWQHFRQGLEKLNDVNNFRCNTEFMERKICIEPLGTVKCNPRL